MKKDVDTLMKKMKIDALYADGSSNRDATMYYLFNGANISGIYIKKRGKPAYVIHAPIEREEAMKTGLKLININKYDIKKIFDKYKDKIKASAILTKSILDDLEVKGNVAFYGNGALGASYNYLRQLIKHNRKIRIAYEPQKSLISRMRETKDEEEIKRIKRTGTKVVKAFNTVIKAVRNMKVKGDVIMKEKNKKLLIGDLKAILRNELYKMKVINSAGLIVAQGRDAGVPHNSGRNRQAVKLDKTIVFDIYPQELGGGYFFDFTRTICFGHAPKKIRELYNVVRNGHDYIIDKLQVGKRTVAIEKMMCKFFEKHGHTTFLSDLKTQVGYCHTLGHGLGLSIHEAPTFGLVKTNMSRIKPGMVFTIEPGLYYPNQGFGIRLEDVIYVTERGKIVNLTGCPKKLVVEL